MPRVAANATTEQYPPRLQALIEHGEAQPPQRRLRDVLAEIGPPQSPVSQAGTRALQEQRSEQGERRIWGELQGALGPEFDELPDGF